MNLKLRFESKFSKLENGCWQWNAGTNSYGYGWFRFNKRPYLAHRFSLYFYRDDFDLNSEKLVLHKCNNPLCVNPDHLYVGSNHDNMNDLIRSGNFYQKKKTHCPQGHEYNEVNTLRYNGWRRCAICHREKEEQRRKRNEITQ